MGALPLSECTAKQQIIPNCKHRHSITRMGRCTWRGRRGTGRVTQWRAGCSGLLWDICCDPPRRQLPATGRGLRITQEHKKTRCGAALALPAQARAHAFAKQGSKAAPRAAPRVPRSRYLVCRGAALSRDTVQTGGGHPTRHSLKAQRAPRQSKSLGGAERLRGGAPRTSPVATCAESLAGHPAACLKPAVTLINRSPMSAEAASAKPHETTGPINRWQSCCKGWTAPS